MSGREQRVIGPIILRETNITELALESATN
jgi:hypothetical protein